MGQIILGLIISIVGLVFTIFGGLVVTDGWNKLHDKLSVVSMSGTLTPNNQSTPRSSICKDIPAEAMVLYMGNSVAYTRKFPHTVIKVGGSSLLVINKHGSNVAISAKFFGKDGKIVAQLKDNRFYINPNNYFRVERPNSHSLVVYDQHGNQTLNVDFMNPSAMKLLGRFYLPNRPPIIIDNKSQEFGGMTISNFCFGENKLDISIQ